MSTPVTPYENSATILVMKTAPAKVLVFPNGNSDQPHFAKSTPDDVAIRAKAIRAALRRSTQSIVEAAALVAEARDALDHSGFRALGKVLGLSHGTLSKLVTIHSRKERFAGREASLPSAWTVLYEVAQLTDGAFESLAASDKLRPELSAKEVKKFVAQQAAAADITKSATDELAYLSVTITFPALLSLAREDHIRQRVFEAIDEPDVAIKVSERRKFRKRR